MVIVSIVVFVLSTVSTMAYGSSDESLELLTYMQQLSLLEPPLLSRPTSCSGEVVGSFNVSGICFLNAALQLLYAACCFPEVWHYIQMVHAHPANRLRKLRASVLDFVNHYTEPRVQWNGYKGIFEVGPGQKWVDAVAKEIVQLNPRHFNMVGGGNVYLAFINMLEALMGTSVNMNYELKLTKAFTLPVGVFLSTTFHKYWPIFPENMSKEEIESDRRWTNFISKMESLPGGTSLERALAYQASKEGLKYVATVWPKVLYIINYTAPFPEAPPSIEEGTKEITKEDIAEFELTAAYATIPLILDLQKIGLSADLVQYRCRGFMLGLIDHASAVVWRHGRWYWCDDALVSSGDITDAIVQQAMNSGKVTVKIKIAETYVPNSVYLYERIV